MEITKREILVSIIIFFILGSLGMIINDLIIENYITKVEQYNKALKIDNDSDTFKYAIDTEVGDILAYGTFNVENGISLDELKGTYAYIRKNKEKYTRHRREECETDSNGDEHCHTEYYYSWDVIGSQDYSADKIKFLDVEFDYNKFTNYPQYSLDLLNNVIDSKKDNVSYNNYLYEKKRLFGANEGDIRYEYYYSPLNFTGTIFAKAKNKTILGNIQIEHSNLQNTLENKKDSSVTINIVFWICWLILTGFAIYGYMYLDNDYLED